MGSKEYNEVLAALIRVRSCYGWGQDLSNQWAPEELEKRRQEIRPGWFSKTGTLKRGEGEILPLFRIPGQISQGLVDLFLFPRALVLESDNDDLWFFAGPGGLQL